MYRLLAMSVAVLALVLMSASGSVEARKAGPQLAKDDSKEAFAEFDRLLPLVKDGSNEESAKEVREALDDKSPWIVIAAVEAVRQAEVDKAGAGKLFLPEVLALMGEKKDKLHKEEIVTVNVIACLGALGEKDSPEALQIVQALVDWQAWSKNKVVRLRHMAEHVLTDMSGEDCTLKDETIEYWRWWIRTKGAAQPTDKPPEKKSKTAPILFKEPIIGTRIVFVIDVSDSMKWPINEEDLPKIKKLTSHLDWTKMPEPCSAMDLAKAELMYSIGQLKPGAEDPEGKNKGTRIQKNDPEKRYFAIITYSEEVKSFSDGWVEASEKNCNIWRDNVEALEPESTTNIHGALLMGFGLNDKNIETDNIELDRECVLSGAHTIVFLTDGYATWSNDSSSRNAKDQFGNPVGDGEYVKPEKLLELALHTNRFRKVNINTVGIGNHDKDLMRQLAKQSGGRYQNWYCRIVWK